MPYSPEEKIKYFAIFTRVFILCLQFLSNLLPDHDAVAFKKPLDSNLTHTTIDNVTNYLFEGLSRWDAQYFLHIAQYGYTYENTLAFFPLFPLLIRQISYWALYVQNNVISCVLPLEKMISMHNMLLISAIIFNNVIFVRTSLILFKLSLIVLKNETLSYISSILFCINPASIFFSAAYSESLYCFLFFYGLLQIELKNFVLSSFLIGLSGLTRSNGIINVGFICYVHIKMVINKKFSTLLIIKFCFCVIMSILPFSFYQFYCYLKFCFANSASMPQFIQMDGIKNNFKFPGSNSSWCNYSIPFAYSYVQNYYWNVGFFKYYQLKQIPNFLLAIPVFIIISKGCLLYVSLHKSSIFYLGLSNNHNITTLPISIFVYVAHCVALSIFSACMIHIQVATRLLFSSSPVPYWFSAWFLSSQMKDSVEYLVKQKFPKNEKEHFFECYENRNSKWKIFLFTKSFQGFALLVKYYNISYFIIGTIMFSNFLPWT